jgi:hypothetical protein
MEIGLIDTLRRGIDGLPLGVVWKWRLLIGREQGDRVRAVSYVGTVAQRSA